jgi:iron complex outermembrane receptor protein
VTIAVSANANGDPTPLQFANVDAEIFAFDTSFGFRINDRWRIDGNAAYLRGKRRDVNDDLYRLSPPNLRVGLSWQRGQWHVTLEERIVGEQRHVSGTLTNDPTNPKNTSDGSSGFALTNVYAQYATDYGIDLTLGVENVWDKKHGEPLSGFNRNSSSPVPIGQRLPGRGRNAFLRVHFVM